MTDDTARESRSGNRRIGPSRARIGLVVVLIILMLMLCAIAYAIFRVVLPGADTQPGDVASPTGLEWVRSIYAWGPGEGQGMDSPVAVAVAPNGTIYGVDTQTNMVMAFNSDGSVRNAVNLIEASGTGATQLGPKSIMLADNGEVYVGANAGQAVYVLTDDLRFVRSFAVGTIPFAMVQDDDTLLISASEGILRFTTDGEFVGSVAPRGLGDGEVNLAQAMVLADDGTLYVADSMSGRVQALDGEGNLIWTTAFGSVLADDVRPSLDATNTSGLQVPSGIALDANDRLIVSDMQLMQIVVLDSEDGSVIATHGEYGYTDGRFTYPMGLAYDPQRDWLVLADMGNSRLQILRIPDSASPNALAAVRRSVVGPAWLCCVPPLLLLILLLVAFLRRRRTSDSLEARTLLSEDDVLADEVSQTTERA